MKYPKYIDLESGKISEKILNKKPNGKMYFEIDKLSNRERKLSGKQGLWIGLYDSKDVFFTAFYEDDLKNCLKRIKKLK